MQTVRITAVPLTPQNFADCGQVITAPDRPADVQSEHISFWGQAVRFVIDGRTEIGFLELSRRPFILTQLERHLTHTQGFIPLASTKLILAAAPPAKENVPRIDTIRAYYLDGSFGILLHKGTWHDILYPVDKSARIVSILREGTSGDDMLIVNLVKSFDTQMIIDVPDL